MSSNLRDGAKTLKSRKAGIVISAILLFLMLGSGVWAYVSTQKNLTISIDGNESSVYTFYDTVEEVLAEEGITLGDNDYINVSLSQALEDHQLIEIKRAVDIAIQVDGEEIKLNTVPATVGEILTMNGIILGENDAVEPGVEDVVEDGTVIAVNRMEAEFITREYSIDYPVEIKKDSTLAVGTEKVLQAGEPGRKTEVYKVTYLDGDIAEKELVSREIVDPVPEIIAKGTYEVASRSQTSTTSAKTTTSTSGTAPNGMSYSKVFTCTATAYTADGTKTKTGTTPRVGAIAVDPSVIPLGTKLYVEGYGFCVAEDTGGAINGYKIDVYLDTEDECVSWGVKTVKVWILQ